MNRTTIRMGVSVSAMALAGAALAQAFTAGGLSVVRVGDGTAGSVSANGSAVSILQYLRSGTGQTGSTSATFATAGTSALTMDGLVTDQGALTRSPNGLFLALAGYAGVHTSALSASNSGDISRKAAVVLFNGTSDATTTANNIYTKGSIRSASTTTGSQLWLTGAANSNAGDGVRYAAVGSVDTSDNLHSGQPDDSGVGGIHNGNLMFTFNDNNVTGGFRGYVGLPTTTGTSPTDLASLGKESGAQGFCFSDGGNVLYIANDGSGSGAVGINRYDLSGGTYVFTRTITSAGAVSGLTCDGVALYATTTGVTGNSLVGLIDDGTTTPAVTTLATAGSDEGLRGVSLSPAASFMGNSYSASGVNSTRVALRSLSGFNRVARVGRTTLLSGSSPGAHRVWADIQSVTYNGHLHDGVKSQGGGSGDTFLLRSQPRVGFLGVDIQVIKVNDDGSGSTPGAVVSLADGFSPVNMAVDASGAVSVLATDGSGNAVIQQFTAALAAGTLLDNTSTGGYSNGSFTAADVTYQPAGGGVRVLWSSAGSMSTTTYTGQTQDAATGTVAIAAAAGGLSVTPVDFEYDALGTLRVLSTGSGATRALFRVDKLIDGHTGVDFLGAAFRRDATGIAPYGGTTAAGLWASSLSVDTNTPLVGLVGTDGGTLDSPTELQAVPGSGRVWALSDSAHTPVQASLRMFPGTSPVN
jgi:hypothetical protein